MAEEFIIATMKHPLEEGPVNIDATIWLGNQTISNIDFTAKDDAGLDSTAVVLDSVKSTYNGVNIRPWIKGGVAGKKYRSFCKVTTNVGVIGVFIVAFDMLSNT